MEDFNCSSDIKDETLWRSIESDSDNPNDDSVGTVFFDFPDDDQSFIDTQKSSIGSEGIIVEPELLDAMRSLQLASAKKLKCPRESNISIDSEQVLASQEINLHPESSQGLEKEEKILKAEEIISQEAETILKTEEVILKEAEKNCDDENSVGEKAIPKETEKISENKEIILKEAEKKTEDKEIIPEKNFELEKKKEKNVKNPARTPKVEGLQKINNKNQRVPFVMTASIAEAMKPLTMKQQPSKKPTVPITPKLLSASRNRSVARSLIKPPGPTTTTINNSSIKRQSSNISSASASSEKSTASGKKNPTKLINTVSTITSTKDGIKLQEEKINNFSIPVTVNRKKRTQFVPFSFSTQKVGNVKANLTLKKYVLGERTVSNKITNKENKCGNTTTIKLPVIKSTAPPKLGAEKRVQERREFNAKIKQRESEIGQVRAQLEEKKNEVIELKKKLVTKTRAMPSFKLPLSTTSSRSTKVLTIPQSAAWSMNNKRL